METPLPKYKEKNLIIENCFFIDHNKGEMWLKLCTDGYSSYNIDPLPEGLE